VEFHTWCLLVGLEVEVGDRNNQKVVEEVGAEFVGIALAGVVLGLVVGTPDRHTVFPYADPALLDNANLSCTSPQLLREHQMVEMPIM
jgi:hypothetical protein